MLKFWCLFVGKDWEIVKTYRHSSQQKIKLFGTILMVPVLLWAINGYLMSTEIFGIGIFGSIICSLFLGTIIYLIEKSILLSTSNRIINTLRIIIGGIVAVLGSLTIDEIIFKNDIDNMVQIYKIESVDSEVKKLNEYYDSKIDSLSKLVKQKSEIYKQRSSEYYLEIEGQANSGVGGQGPVARRKETLMNRAYEDLNTDQKLLQQLQSDLTQNLNFSKMDARENFNDKGLLLRMKALFRLIWSDWVSLIVFSLYFTLLLIMETLVIILKKFTPNSVDEELEKLGDDLIISKWKTTLKQRKDFYNL